MEALLDLFLEILSGFMENWDKLNTVTKKVLIAIIISTIITFLYWGLRGII